MDTLPVGQGLEAFIGTIWHSEALELLRSLPDNSVDMILTSPPYDNLRTYKGFTWDFEAIAKEAYRVLKDGGVLVWVVGDATVKGSETLTSFRQALYFVDTCGFRMHDTMIYQKDGSPFPESNRYQNEFEYMFVLSKGKPKTFNGLRDKTKYGGSASSTTRDEKGRISNFAYAYGHDTKLIGNVWQINSGYMKSTMDLNAYQHPAIFPELLAERHILSWSNENDIVLDFFSGSGTTAKIARNLNRRFIAGDLSLEYCEIARQRLLNTDPFESTMFKSGDIQLSLFKDMKPE